jgi:hypothetical protein
MQSLMRIIDVANYLGTTPGAAKNWLKKHNVPVIDLGRGRGLGLRYKLLHIEEAINAALIEKKPNGHALAKKPQFKQGLIRGRCRAEVISELTETSPVQ